MASSSEVFEEVVIAENQRYVPGRGWSSGNLMALDPHAYCNVKDVRYRGSSAGSAAPSGVAWVDADWRVILDESTDTNGWRYASRFSGQRWRSMPSSVSVVRCRTWKRRLARRRLAGEVSVVQAAPSVMNVSTALGARARLIELSRSIREAEELLAREEANAAHLTAAEKRNLREAAREARERAEALERKGDDTAWRERATEDELVKRLLFPGYDSRMAVRGEGVAVAAQSIDVERVSGQFIVHAHPSAEMPQFLLEALGADGGNQGVRVEAVVVGLVIKSDLAGSTKRRGLPTSLKVRRISLRAEVGLSTRIRCVRTITGGDSCAVPKVEFHVDQLSVKLHSFAAPGIVSKSTASAVLGLVKPTLKRALKNALPPELGLAILELKSPLVVAGEFVVNAEPSLRVTAAKLDDQRDSRSAEARALCGWTALQARAFGRARDELCAATANNGAKHNEWAAKRLSSLSDVVLYVRRLQTDDDDAANDFTGHGKEHGLTRVHIPQRTFELRARLDTAWSEVAALWNLRAPDEEHWTWTALRDTARRLRRRPVSVSLRLPTLAGALGLCALHDRLWQLVERTAPDESSCTEGFRARRDKVRVEIEALSRIVGEATARVDACVTTDSLALEVTDGRVKTHGASPRAALELFTLTQTLSFKADQRAPEAQVPFDLAVRPATVADVAPLQSLRSASARDDTQSSPDDYTIASFEAYDEDDGAASTIGDDTGSLVGEDSALDDDLEEDDDDDFEVQRNSLRALTMEHRRAEVSTPSPPRPGEGLGVALDIDDPKSVTLTALGFSANLGTEESSPVTDLGPRRTRILAVELGSRQNQPSLRLETSPHLVAEVSFDRLVATAMPPRLLLLLRGIFADVPKLQKWWPEPVDPVKCADGLDAVVFLLDHVFAPNKSTAREFTSIKLDCSLTASLNPDDKHRPCDSILTFTTLNHGITLDVTVFARDFLLAVVRLANRFQARRLFGIEFRDERGPDWLRTIPPPAVPFSSTASPNRQTTANRRKVSPPQPPRSDQNRSPAAFTDEERAVSDAAAVMPIQKQPPPTGTLPT